jgi:FkbM family methyltransferase
VSVIRIQTADGREIDLPPLVQLTKRQARINIDTTLRYPRAGCGDEWYTRWWLSEFVGDWEPETFEIFDRFLRPTDDFLDIGAWIGPTALYAANTARHVYALEPDPIAFQMLKAQMTANTALPNITAIQSALGDSEATVPFGGNGDMGNSESTLLVREPDYLTTPTAKPWGSSPEHALRWKSAPQTTVPQITMVELGRMVDLSNVRFVKMDIEGGEKYALPGVLEWAKSTKPALYLSLHWKFLPLADIERLVAGIYATFPFVYDETMVAPVGEDECLSRALSSLVCTWEPL